MAKTVRGIRKSRVVKNRNAETFTESAFWSFIRSALRQKSRWWKPITIAKHKARRPYKGNNKRQKYEYLCNICKQWFSEKNISIDHKIPAGSLNCAADLPGFVERLFVEEEGLQCICNKCHDVKTKSEKSERIK
jgi:5-methylcytosine-specific restriction endonuclease McrA